MQRYFSIASAPHEKQVKLTTRFAPKSSSFKQALKKLKPGDAIEAREKGGDFILDHRRKIFVFVAGGIGITPFRLILLDMNRNQKPLNVQLLYANRDNDFPYRKGLEVLKKRHPEFRIDFVVGPQRIDEKAISKLVPDMDKPVFYVSGPESMVESLDKTLKKLGVQKNESKTISFQVTIGHEWSLIKYAERIAVLWWDDAIVIRTKIYRPTFVTLNFDSCRFLSRVNGLNEV